ncbi:MAG: low-specificity L-threonine aldolase [Deltaproteobacteria bacterium]|nr:low-specificity L-threonine aldolase [Deltaproteobacteria bacterium]
MDEFVDLRSDTVTKPTPGMRKAMFEAEVGDDVFGEDPTINALQEKVARILGKEKAVFVPSGTMANQLSIKAHTQPGDEVVLEENSHAFYYEGGAGAVLSGVQFFCLSGKRGLLESSQVEESIRPLDVHFPVTRLICLENTHNRGGGTVYPIKTLSEIYKLAKARGLLVHMDGARLWNASAASVIKPEEYAQWTDSVSVCLSKGLGAPVGSLVAGSVPFIDRVHRFRKMFGGGMRQAGILAAAGIYALDHHLEKLKATHDQAKRLACFLSGLKGVSIDPAEVETNIVIFDVSKSPKKPVQIAGELRTRGVLILPMGKTSIRLVTHIDISDAGIEQAMEAFGQVFS